MPMKAMLDVYQRTWKQADEKGAIFPITDAHRADLMNSGHGRLVDEYDLHQDTLVRLCRSVPDRWPFLVVLAIMRLMSFDRYGPMRGCPITPEWREKRPRVLREARELIHEARLSPEQVGVIITGCVLALPMYFFVAKTARREADLRNLQRRIAANEVAPADIGPWFAELTS